MSEKCTLREVLLADMYEEKIEMLKAELSRYTQGVEVEGMVEQLHPAILFECGYIRLPKEMIGHRVKVLVMKEDV